MVANHTSVSCKYSGELTSEALEEKVDKLSRERDELSTERDDLSRQKKKLRTERDELSRERDSSDTLAEAARRVHAFVSFEMQLMEAERAARVTERKAAEAAEQCPGTRAPKFTNVGITVKKKGHSHGKIYFTNVCSYPLDRRLKSLAGTSPV